MSDANTVIKSKVALSRDDLADLLEDLSERIREGSVTLSQGGESVTFALPNRLRTSVEIKDSPKLEGTKREFELELTWEVDETGAPINDDSAGPITIS